MDWKNFEYEKPLIGQSVLVCGPLYKEPKIAKRMNEPEKLQHGLLAFFVDEWSCVLVNVKWWMPLPSIPNAPRQFRSEAT
jgi:hypothetical protein